MHEHEKNLVEDAYAEKLPDYYDQSRQEMVELIPRTCERILEVGCGTGAFGAQVKNHLKAEYWGIEPDLAACKVANERLDKVHCGRFSADLRLPENFFDCIVFNDVLEHLFDPGHALTFAKSLLRHGGVVVASIPNIRHFPTVWRLVVDGDWEYTERGILDKTHVRFFTRQSIHTLFEVAGYQIERMEGIDPFCEMIPADRKAWRFYKLISRLPISLVRDMRYLRFAIRTQAKQIIASSHG
jgi:SAM-dependent methyltransferase